MRDPYVVLGVDKNSSAEEITAAYERLKARYGEERFLYGEAGNQGAKNLAELEEAWGIVSVNLKRSQGSSEFGGELGYIDDLVRNGKVDEAQRELDNVANRNGDWHYLQSIVYYKREWLTESRKQLIMAINLEPNNTKYKIALEKLDVVMANPNVNANTYGQQAPPPPQNPNMGNTLSNCCCAYCLADCCCTTCRMC